MPTSKAFTESGRDAWGASHGAGKGDKPRHRLDEQFRENYEAIKWSPRTGERKFRKIYR